MSKEYKNFRLQLAHRKEACDYESSHLMQNSSARVKENFPDVVNALMDKLYQSNGFETFLNQIRVTGANTTAIISFRLLFADGKERYVAFPVCIHENSISFMTVIDITEMKSLFVNAEDFVVQYDETNDTILHGLANGIPAIVKN